MEVDLRTIRKKMQLTQGELASMVGATKRQIGAWERGENDLPLDYATSIATVLGCTLDELAGRPAPAPPPAPELSAGERELVDLWRRMDPAYREMLYKTAVAYCEMTEKNGAAAVGAARHDRGAVR